MYLERHIKNVWSFDFPPDHFTFQQAQQNQPPTLAFHQARCVHMGKWKCRTNPSQASTMVSYKKTQKRKQTHHGKWVTKNAKGAMKRKGNIVDDASNVAKKALPEGWCGKVVKIQLWVLVAVTVSLASFLPLLLLFRFSSKRQQLENCNCRSIQTSTVPLFVTTLVMHKGLYLKKKKKKQK